MSSSSAADAEGSEATVHGSWQRTHCTGCKTSFKFYCPRCCVPLGVPEGTTVPRLTLPLQVHIWFQDKLKKSSAPHAKVLAPNDVEIIPWPLEAEKTPTYDRASTLVVYPSIDSETLADFTPESLQQVKTLVFIDCPWQKAPVILHDSALAKLRCVKLAKPPVESKFWRYHKAGAGCVSTIEAIQLMLTEYNDAAKQADIKVREGSEATDLSDLFFYFNLLYGYIADKYVSNPNLDEPPPMDEDAKERRRQLYNQKEAGRKRKLANKHSSWVQIKTALERGEITEIPRGACFNCREHGHEARECTKSCRYCKDPDHWSGICPMKKVRHEEMVQKQHKPITKAL